MKYFFDTEFDEDGKTIELISIGMVDENGREFYAVSNEFNPDKCNDWVKANVLPLLPPQETWISREQIAEGLLRFVSKEPVFWAYYADYDWVTLCQLFGRMLDLPEGWPMYCKDLKQLKDHYGVQTAPEQSQEHNALADAQWNKELYDHIMRTK